MPKYTVGGDRLHVLSPQLSLTLGFYLDPTAETFIRGLFQDQRLRLGDRTSQAAFSVDTVEMLPLQWPGAPGPVRIRTLSPLVVARKHPGVTPDEYLPPTDPGYARLLFSNLLEKYRAATGAEPPNWWDATRFDFRLAAGRTPRSKLITIKTGTAAQTQVRGWTFDFELDAPRELVELGLLAGFGRMNSEGFGFGELVKGGGGAS